jgi:hypothetical protein
MCTTIRTLSNNTRKVTQMKVYEVVAVHALTCRSRNLDYIKAIGSRNWNCKVKFVWSAGRKGEISIKIGEELSILYLNNKILKSRSQWVEINPQTKTRHRAPVAKMEGPTHSSRWRKIPSMV